MTGGSLTGKLRRTLSVSGVQGTSYGLQRDSLNFADVESGGATRAVCTIFGVWTARIFLLAIHGIHAPDTFCARSVAFVRFTIAATSDCDMPCADS